MKKKGIILLDSDAIEVRLEEEFILSSAYQKLTSQGICEELMPHHYLLKSVQFYDKSFELVIRPICYGFPFMIHLVEKDSQYFESRSDWELKSDINILKKSMQDTSSWLKKRMELSAPNVENEDLIRWQFDWGRISVSFETKSFDFGIFITWNLNKL